MKIFLKTLKYLGYSIAGFIAFLLVYLLSAAVLSRIAVNTEEVSQKEETIWLLSNGAHTDIVMPVKNDFFDWQTIVSQQDTRGKGESRYIALGWGCRKFYLETPTWADLKFNTAFQAVTGQGGTLMHATFYDQIPADEQAVSIALSTAQYKKLVALITQTFVLQEGKGVLVPTDAVYGDTDAFYEAHGHYQLFFTCNSWTNKMLKNSGIRSCVWTPFASGVMRNYQNKNN